MQRFYNNLRSKGSITIEASVILPFFLSAFFLMLFLVKFICTGMVLDYAVNETAKEIAAAAYPLSFINELEDEKIGEYGNARIPVFGEEIEKLAQQLDEGSFDILNVIVSKDLKERDITDALKGVLKDYGKGVIGSIVNVMTPAYWEMKSAVKYKIADTLIKEHLNSPLISKENIRLRIFEFPQGKEEYSVKSDNKLYGNFGLTPGKDFGSEDVVLQLEYGYRVKLPFFEALNVKTVHTAVEKAWIKGSFGVMTSKEEGLNLESKGRTVFITRTGIRYHRGDCRYLRKSKIPRELEDAENEGYTPCKVCKPAG